MPRARDHHDHQLEYDAYRAEHRDPGAGKAIDPTAPLGTLEQIPPDRAAGRKRRLYFTDPSGTRWRVYDTSFGPPEGPSGHAVAFPPPYAGAKARVFVAADGQMRAFLFNERHAPPESRRVVVTPRVVSAQFRLAGYPSLTKEEFYDPRRDLDVAPMREIVPPIDEYTRWTSSTINRWTAYEAD